MHAVEQRKIGVISFWISGFLCICCAFTPSVSHIVDAILALLMKF